MSGAFDKSVRDGNTILLKIMEEKDKRRYFYLGGDMICSFLTYDKVYKFISNLGNNLTPYSIAECQENVYFLTQHFKFFIRGKVIDCWKQSLLTNVEDKWNYCWSIWLSCSKLWKILVRRITNKQISFKLW